MKQQLLVNQPPLLQQRTNTYVFIFSQQIDVAILASPPLVRHIGKTIAGTSRYTYGIWKTDFLIHQIIQYSTSEYATHTTAFEH